MRLFKQMPDLGARALQALDLAALVLDSFPLLSIQSEPVQWLVRMVDIWRSYSDVGGYTHFETSPFLIICDQAMEKTTWRRS